MGFVEFFNFLELEIWHAKSFYSFAIMLVLNLIFALIIIRGIYYRINKNTQYVFTFFIFNVLVFCITFVMADIKLKTGFAFGLFAVFSILRYRTEPIPIKEMTFLFISIIVAVINALALKEISLIQLLFTNIVIVISTWILEKAWLKHYSTRVLIVYEKINLLEPQHRQELIKDIEARTGFSIKRIDIESVDFLRDIARIYVYH